MTRDEFLKVLGLGAVATASMFCFGGCSSDSPAAPQNVDFTIDISQSSYATLQNIGGFIIKDGVIIAHIESGEYIALSAACTHEGTIINYNSGQNLFVCPAHGSEFNTDGTVAKNPANKSLTKYNVTVTGNSIRVYS
ncbi:MAG: hypothetical protein A2X64_01310 [Ignavibacteria bacterium GWF2_33_9]|nr:MAG: hypothetical protein A2X64_01310 [Ignavibacteria bacterium GWF2_33_9]